MAEVASNTALFRSWLADHQKQHPGTPLDSAAAFLFGTITWNLLEDLARGWLEAGNARLLDTESIAVAMEWEHWVHENEEGDHPRYVFSNAWLPERAEDQFAYQRTADDLGQIFAPWVETLSRLAGIPVAALWRLLGDSISSAFLEAGELAGRPEEGMAHGHEILARCTSPIRNKQVAYFSLTLSEDRSQRRKPQTRWFLKRGGCCRYYKVDGGEYCTSCVLRDDESRQERLLDYLQRTITIE